MAARELRTDRLLLRGWRDEDLEPFAALNADPEVMAHFPAPLDRAASDAFAARCRAHLEELALDEVVAFTSAANLRSRAVMERLGMAHDPDDDFDHPRFPDWEGRRHVLFRLRRPVA